MKNFNCSRFENLKMNNDTYEMRRDVINIIYGLKKKITLPRIDVRITENHMTVLGCARMKNNIIWISQTCTNRPNDLYSIVLHEILHAVYGIEHDENCDLMSSQLKKINKEKALKCFLKYVN